MRVLKVTLALAGGVWEREHDLPLHEQFEIMVPDEANLRGVPLYAARINGPHANARYTDQSIVILSKLVTAPGEIMAGRRYHVRITRADGLVEETIRCLVERDGKYWLKPESDHPNHQSWMPLDGQNGDKVELIGRVRGVYLRED